MSDEGRMPPRYGFDVNGYARQMYDGYWTPWHIAKDQITALRAALDQERRRLAWIADNTGRDVWLDQFDRRFSKGEGADGADDLRAAIDALLSGRPKESPH